MSDTFRFKTNWSVITGAPSSGKTSVIEELSHRGFVTQREVARELIELGLNSGKTLEETRHAAKRLQKDILQLALARESTLDPAEYAFLDRGLPDSLTYFRLAGVESAEVRTISFLFQYRAVFLFDRLPIVKDDVRTEDEALADKIDKMLEDDYKSVGYAPIRVPVMPITARADFILTHLNIK